MYVYILRYNIVFNSSKLDRVSPYRSHPLKHLTKSVSKTLAIESLSVVKHFVTSVLQWCRRDLDLADAFRQINFVRQERKKMCDELKHSLKL